MIITEETLRQLKSREPIQCETKAYTFEDIMKLPKEHITELLFVTFHRCEEMDEKIIMSKLFSKTKTQRRRTSICWNQWAFNLITPSLQG